MNWKRRWLFSVLAAIPALAQRRTRTLEAEHPVLAKDDGEKRILSVLNEMERQKETYLSVPAQDGRWLRVLTETANARHVVEIGTSTGYSGLWFSLALRGTGGKLTTFEMDAGRAAAAREHFRKAGVDGLIAIVEGDAHTELKKLDSRPVDVAFIDADKSGYVDYWRQIAPRVRPGGLVLAHNIGMSPEYVRTATADPAFETVFYMGGGELAVTLRKR